MNMRNKTLALIVIIAALLVLNFFSEMFFFRIDLTEDRQYTLSNATRHILKNIDTTVSVTAYFSENLPPDFIRAKKDFEDLLIEYNRLSGGKMEYRFIAPGKDPKIEDEAIQAGIQPVMINVREKDQMKQQKAFLGAVLQLGENKDAIPFIQPGAALEYALSTAIKKISVADKPFIGFLTGQGEPEISHMAQVYGVLSPLYNIEPVALTDTAPVPDRFKTLVIVAPTDSFSQPQLSQLDRFLQQGGNILVAINRVSGNFQTLYGAEINTGLEQWLRSKGITVENSFLIDARCGTVALQQQQGMFSFTTNISFPYLPVISSFASHPVVKGIEGVMLTFASPVRFSGNSAQGTFTPLAFSSHRSAVLNAPQSFNVQRQWSDFDFPLASQPVAGVLINTESSGSQSKILVIGDGDFAVNGPIESRIQLQPDNVNLMVNAIEWLSDQSGLIELRTKGIQFRPLKPLDDSSKALIKYLNFLAPVLLVIGYGVVRVQLSRNRKIKRMQENFS
jgi:gliding-associated putative ABC transporter substrate-binding component GldG